MIWDFDLEFSIFLTFSYFWAFTLVSIKKIVSFTFLRYFNLKAEYKGVLFASMIMKYTISNHISSPPPFSKFSDPPLALFLKRNHPKQYQLSKRFFTRNKFLEIGLCKLKFRLTIRDWLVRKNLRFWSSFLRFDRKCSELGPALITKAGSAPVIWAFTFVKTCIFNKTDLFFDKTPFWNCLFLSALILKSQFVARCCSIF